MPPGCNASGAPPSPRSSQPVRRPSSHQAGKNSQRATSEQVSASLLATRFENCQLRERMAAMEERMAAMQITDTGRVGPGSAPGAQMGLGMIPPISEMLAQARSPVQFDVPAMQPTVQTQLPGGTGLPPVPPAPGIAWSTASGAMLGFQAKSPDEFAAFGRCWFLPLT